LKFDAHWAARTHGRERAWAMADVDHAVGRSVERAARRERTRPIDRRPIAAEERARFQRELARARRVWQERLGLADYVSLRALDKATLDREAIPMALENLDYLKVTRRRVTPPIRRKIA
jgi:hypothetical protein